MKTRPFHESVLHTITRCSGGGENARNILSVVGDLIIKTTIEKDHQKIKSAFKKAVDYWGDGKMDGMLLSVSDKLSKEETKLKK